jgi:hypothetical protein
VEPVQAIDDSLFKVSEANQSPFPAPPEKTSTGTPQTMTRRSSFITGKEIDLSQPKANTSKLTRRASRLSVTMDLSTLNQLMSPTIVGNPSGNSSSMPVSSSSAQGNNNNSSLFQAGGKPFQKNLSHEDLLALKVLFLHLKENPSDLVAATLKIQSQQDLAMFSYILVHRVYGQFSNDLLNLCDLFDVAIKYETPSSMTNILTVPQNLSGGGAATPMQGGKLSQYSNPIYQTGFPDKLHHPGNYLDEFNVTATLLSSSIRGAAGGGNINSQTSSAAPGGSSAYHHNYYHLYFNEFIQYFSYAVRPNNSSVSPHTTSGSNNPSTMKNLMFSGGNLASSVSNSSSRKENTLSIQSNSLLLLILYEVSHRLDIISFFEVLCSDILLSHIHFPYLTNFPPGNDHSNNDFGSNAGLNFMISVSEICQYIIDPIAVKLEYLIQQGSVPKLLLLMMKKLSNFYIYENYYKEYFLSICIPYILHKIMIYCKLRMEEQILVYQQQQQQLQAQQQQYMQQQNFGLMSPPPSNIPFPGGVNTMPFLGNQNNDEQLILMIQYIKQVLLLCFNSSSSASATASSNVGSNNSILINQKVITLSLSDVAILSKSKWTLTRSFDHLVHLIEDLNRQNIHNYSAATLTSTSNSGGGVSSFLTAANKTAMNSLSVRSPLATLSLLHAYTGKSRILDSYLCMRPSELLFLLQLFDLYNITSSSLMISSSRQLSQAISVIQSNDLIGKLSSFSIGSGSISTSMNKKTYQKLSLDREMTVLIEMDPSILNYKQFDSLGGAGNNRNIPTLLGNKTWGDIFSPSAGNNQSLGQNNSASTDHQTVYQHHSSMSRAPSFLSTGAGNLALEDPTNFLLGDPTTTNADNLLNNNMYQENNELNSIQWLINTARITLKYIYENISNISLQKSKSIIKELYDINHKLMNKKKLIQDILFDYNKLLINKDLLFHYKLILQFLMDFVQMNQSLNMQMRSKTGAGGSSGGQTPAAKRNSISAASGNNPLQLLTNTSNSNSIINSYLDIYHFPLQFDLMKILSFTLYQDYYSMRFHFYVDEEKEFMLNSLIYKGIHYEKQLSTLFLQQQQYHFQHQQHLVAQENTAETSGSFIPGNTFNSSGGIGGGLLSQKIQQQKLVFVSSSAMNQSSNLGGSGMTMMGDNHPLIDSLSSSTASNLAMPTTGGMNPLRVIMQNVFNSSSSSTSSSSAVKGNPLTMSSVPSSASLHQPLPSPLQSSVMSSPNPHHTTTPPKSKW